MKEGECGYVLPKHKNLKYIDIQLGHYFGDMDIVGTILERKELDIYTWIQSKS